MVTEIELFDKIENTIQYSEDLLTKADEDNYLHLYSSTLFSPMISIVKGCLTLYRSKLHFPTYILVRSFYELYADLIILHKNHHYIFYLEFKGLNERLRYITNIEKNSSENIQLSNIKANLSSLQEYLKSFKFEALGVKDRFKLAGLEDLFNSIYWLFSNYTHGNILVGESHLAKKENTIDLDSIDSRLNHANQLFEALLKINLDSKLNEILKELIRREI